MRDYQTFDNYFSITIHKANFATYSWINTSLEYPDMDTANRSERTEHARTAIDMLASLIEKAFEGDPSHSLIANLHDLQEEDWTATPLGSHRSIADILEHVGWSKWMYEDYAFGSASMRGDQPPLVPQAGARSRTPD